MTATATKTRIDEDEATRARQEFLNGLSTIPTFALAMGKSTRTIQRLVALGELPVVTLGRTKFINITRSRKSR